MQTIYKNLIVYIFKILKSYEFTLMVQQNMLLIIKDEQVYIHYLSMFDKFINLNDFHFIDHFYAKKHLNIFKRLLEKFYY